jgi:drug/metabolite transporter (DMT)-like permease
VHRAAEKRTAANWSSIVSLFAYVTLFSFAYLSLSAATGALILFGAVQLTMFIFALRRGEHFTLLSWGGLTMAILGLIYLIWPGVTGPDPLGGAILMAISGNFLGPLLALGQSDVRSVGDYDYKLYFCCFSCRIRQLVALP